jgi:outer membrane lipopolysaccharide assembly protein LptE/RlpB
MLFMVSCGYKFENKKTQFKEKYNIYVDYFKNKTDEPRIEDHLIKELKREFIIYPNIHVVFKDEADYFLTGEITEFSKSPISYSETDKTLEYRVFIKIKAYLYDSKGNLIKQKQFSWNKEYSSGYTPSKDEEFDVGVSENQKKYLILKICKDLSSEVYHWLYSYNF